MGEGSTPTGTGGGFGRGRRGKKEKEDSVEGEFLLFYRLFSPCFFVDGVAIDWCCFAGRCHINTY